MRLKKPLLFNCPPRHLHVVTLLRTKCVVDDRAPAGISEIHEPRRMKDGWWKSPRLGDGVSLKTPRGRQRETTCTSLISQVTDDGTSSKPGEVEPSDVWTWQRAENLKKKKKKNKTCINVYVYCVQKVLLGRPQGTHCKSGCGLTP